MKDNRLDGFFFRSHRGGEEQVGNHDSYLDELLVTDRYGSKALEAKRCRPQLSSYLPRSFVGDRERGRSSTRCVRKEPFARCLKSSGPNLCLNIIHRSFDLVVNGYRTRRASADGGKMIDRYCRRSLATKPSVTEYWHTRHRTKRGRNTTSLSTYIDEEKSKRTRSLQVKQNVFIHRSTRSKRRRQTALSQPLLTR